MFAIIEMKIDFEIIIEKILLKLNVNTVWDIEAIEQIETSW